MNIARFDLNLLRTLDTLEQERSVQLAASRLNVTASAVSHALSRLRRDLNDPLFVRSSAGLVPTQRCLATVSRVRPLLATVAATLEGTHTTGEEFDPTVDCRSLTLALPGALELSLLPALVGRLRAQSPGWTVAVREFQRRTYEVELRSAELDVVLSVGGHTPRVEGLSISMLWEDELVALQGPQGPLPKGTPVPLEQLVACPQIYPLPWPRAQNYLDIRLARGGRRRAIALSVPSYAAVGPILMQTDLVASMPDRTALAVLRHYPRLDLVRIFPAQVNTLAVETSTAFQESSAGRWFLAQLRSVAKEVPGLGTQALDSPSP
jgi:DNA-binding transcriptional LysR family regulator